MCVCVCVCVCRYIYINTHTSHPTSQFKPNRRNTPPNRSSSKRPCASPTRASRRWTRPSPSPRPTWTGRRATASSTTPVRVGVHACGSGLCFTCVRLSYPNKIRIASGSAFTPSLFSHHTKPYKAGAPPPGLPSNQNLSPSYPNHITPPRYSRHQNK